VSQPLEERYFERMATSLGDKAELLRWIRGPRVLDVGAGGGELAGAIAATGAEVTALDDAPDSLARLRARGDIAHVVEGHADEIAALVSDPFDTIVLSSVVHEMHAYGTSTGLRGFDAVDASFAALRAVLAPGGRIVIRDGVLPENPDGHATVTVPDDRLVADYLTLSPHPELRLHQLEPGRWGGTRHAVAELMLTLTWGRETLHREALERYQLFTGAGYVEYLAPELACVARWETTQQGYVDHLADYRAESDGVTWFPHTNGVWIFDATP
jgi:SAM-dependent methyltransferase